MYKLKVDNTDEDNIAINVIALFLPCNSCIVAKCRSHSKNLNIIDLV